MSDFTIRGISFTKDIALACIIDGSISDCHIEQYEDAPILLKGIFHNKDFSNPAAVNKYLHILLADLIEFVEDQTMGESTTKFPQDAVCRIKVSSDESYEDDYIGVFWNLPGIGETSVLPDYYIAKLINFAVWEQETRIINTRIKLGYALDWNSSIFYEEEEASDTILKVYNELTENDTDDESTHLSRIVSVIKAYRRDITFPKHSRVNAFYWPQVDETPASIELSCPTSEKDSEYIQIPDIINYLQEEGKQKATLLPVRYQIGWVFDWDRIYTMKYCDKEEVISTIFDKLELAPKGTNLSAGYKFAQIIKNIKSYCMDSFCPDTNSTVNVYYRPQTETIELFTRIEDIELVSISDLYNYIHYIHTSDSEEKEESIHDDIRIESIRVFSSKYKNHEGDGVLMARNEILYAIEDNEIVRYRIRNISVQNKDNETKYCFDVVNFDSLEPKTLYEDDLGVTLFGSYDKAKEKLQEKDFFKQAFVLIPKGNNNVHLYIDGEEYIAEPPVILDNGECTRIDITGAINFAINGRMGKEK